MNRTQVPLPRRAPARVLACGAFLKNTACLLDGDRAWLSPLHGDLQSPQACAALEASLAALVDAAGGAVDAVAHDLHPDFASTRRALAWADRLGVPAIAVQHHHAHAAVVQAEQGVFDEALVALALDGWCAARRAGASRICRPWRCRAVTWLRANRGAWPRRRCTRSAMARRSSRDTHLRSGRRWRAAWRRCCNVG